jgi:hypothetical protein
MCTGKKSEKSPVAGLHLHLASLVLEYWALDLPDYSSVGYSNGP